MALFIWIQLIFIRFFYDRRVLMENNLHGTEKEFSLLLFGINKKF